ncbi:MAG: Quinone oxidoreductase, partial [uncultured Rubrobacteraceae bacterium]
DEDHRDQDAHEDRDSDAARGRAGGARNAPAGPGRSGARAGRGPGRGGRGRLLRSADAQGPLLLPAQVPLRAGLRPGRRGGERGRGRRRGDARCPGRRPDGDRSLGRPRRARRCRRDARPRKPRPRRRGRGRHQRGYGLADAPPGRRGSFRSDRARARCFRRGGDAARAARAPRRRRSHRDRLGPQARLRAVSRRRAGRLQGRRAREGARDLARRRRRRLRPRRRAGIGRFLRDAPPGRDARHLRFRLHARQQHGALDQALPTHLRPRPPLERHPRRQEGDVLLRKALAQVLRGGPLHGLLAARRREDRGARDHPDAARRGGRSARAPGLRPGERQGGARAGTRRAAKRV